MGNYDDILHLPHHKSAVYPSMSMHDRAAQFAPFAALTGYGDAIDETARSTDRKLKVEETKAQELDEAFARLSACVNETPSVSVMYFVPDEKKAGGTYVTTTGNVRKVDLFSRTLVFVDGTRLALDDIYEIDGDFLQNG